MSPDTALAVREEPKAIAVIRDALDKRAADLEAVLPPGMDRQRFARVALLAVSKNADLLKCTPGSIVRAIVEAAQIGLEPTGSLSRAWLVPFGTEAQLIVGYQGLADLMRDTGRITKIETEVVYEGDHFKVIKGTSPRIEHEPTYDTDDPSKITHVYAIATFTDGDTQAEVMTRAQVEVIRAKSRSKNGKAWLDSWGQMARKTVLRRLANYVPLSTKAVEAIEREDAQEFGGSEPAPALPSRATSLHERVKARKAHLDIADDTSEDESRPPEEAPATDQKSTNTVPDTSAAPQTCGNVADDAGVAAGESCGLEAEHSGPHKNAERSASWPRT